MTKFVQPASLDALLDHVSEDITGLHIVTGDPVTRAETLSASRASFAFTAANVAKANGDVSGRKNIYQAIADMDIVSSGQIDHYVLVSNTEIKFKTELENPQLVTAGGKLSTQSVDHEVREAA